MWAEHAPEEPAMADTPALWLATMQRPNAQRMTWVVRGEAAHQVAGVAVLSLPSSDNRHLGSVDLRVAPPYRRRRIGRSLLTAVAARAKAEHRRVLAGFTWDLVAAGEAFVTSFGGEQRQI